MIIETLINLLFSFFEMTIGKIEIDVSVASSFFEKIFEILRMGAYLLPMDTVIAILSITIALLNFRIIIAVLKTLWNVLPLV